MGLNAKICLHLTFRIWGVNALRAFSLKILNAINAKFSHQVCKKHQKASYNKHAKLKKNSSELLSLKAYWSSILKKYYYFNLCGGKDGLWSCFIIILINNLYYFK